MDSDNDAFDQMAENINSKLKEIFDSTPIQLASVIIQFKGSDKILIAERGHFYEITKLMSTVLKDHQSRIIEEAGLG